jgi:hypothetical protein
MPELTYRDAVAHYFKAHPNTWIDGLELARVGGAYAWRTRVSECRELGMTIDNEVRTYPNTRRKVSLYKYSPVPVQISLDLDISRG